ncbi:hypothetical protein [Castellaniella sp. GW247-6E4]|uniref:hypothetical protein n=1 Tax=Castellaniella sp. GW247-6E4 TaxID=3140380 RepID=UPI003314D30E
MSALEAPAFPAAPAAAGPSSPVRRDAPADAVHVNLGPAGTLTISSAGRALAGAMGAAGGSDDIEDSSLPDQIKSVLRHIRELRRILERLVLQLRQAQADVRAEAPAKQAREQQLQAQISTYNAAMIAAMHKLNGLMSRVGLDSAQKMTTVRLALK